MVPPADQADSRTLSGGAEATAGKKRRGAKKQGHEENGRVRECHKVIGRQNMKVWRKALVYSLPVWVFLIIDTSVFWARLNTSLIAGWIHLPGLMLQLLPSPTWAGIHNYSLYTVCALNCLFYHLVVWIIVYLVQRRRTRRSARSD